MLRKSKNECKLDIFIMPFNIDGKFKDNFITQKLLYMFYLYHIYYLVINIRIHFIL